MTEIYSKDFLSPFSVAFVLLLHFSQKLKCIALFTKQYFYKSYDLNPDSVSCYITWLTMLEHSL